MTDEQRMAEFDRLNLLRSQLVKALALPPAPIPLHRGVENIYRGTPKEC